MNYFIDECVGDCTIQVPFTPKYIKENYMSGTPAVAYDIFALAFAGLTYPVQPSVLTDLQAQCWQRFGHRPIGDYDYEYFTECLKDKVAYEWNIYVKGLPLLLSADLMSLISSKSVDNEDVDSLTTNDLSQVEDGATAQTGTNLTEEENEPDVAAGATRYITGKTTVTPNLNESVDRSVTNTGTVHVVNGRDASSERYDGLTVEQTATVINAYHTLAERFVNNLEPLFLKRW